MNLDVPLIVQSGSNRSLVSQITFHDDDDDLSQISGTSFKCSNEKWYVEEEICHYRNPLEVKLDPSRIPLSSLKPLPKPERKCSVGRSNNQETKYDTLEIKFSSIRRSKRKQENNLPTLSPIPQESKGKMANAKWEADLSPSRGTVATLLSPVGSRTEGSSGHARLTMTGIVDGSTHRLRKPIRRSSRDDEDDLDFAPDLIRAPCTMRRTFPSLNTMKNKHHSTMPLTMPIRKSSTQDLLNLPSSGSQNVLGRKNHASAVGYKNQMAPPTRSSISSAPSMVKTQSRCRLQVRMNRDAHFTWAPFGISKDHVVKKDPGVFRRGV